MVATVKHAKVSAIPDAGDASLVEPSDWNANHVLTGVQGAISLTTTGTSGPATLIADTLNIPQYADGAGTVTTVSVVSANGLAGSVANPTTTPALTLSTTITGVLKGNATAISAATVGTDYSVGTSALATGLLKSTTATGALSIAAAGTDYEVPLTFSTGLTRTVNTVTVNTSQSIAKLSNLTNNGLVNTSAGDGTLGVTVPGTGILTALGVNVGSAGAPVLFNGALGTPSSGTLTSATGLPISTGVSGLGTGIATALAVNVGTAGAPVINGGALGTPSSGTATNLSGTAASLTAGNVTTNANLTGVITSVGNATSIASQTGTGTKFVVDTSPTLVTPLLGTPTSGTLTNCTGLKTVGGLAGTGQSLVTFRPQQAESPATLYGVFGTRNAHPYLGFNDTTNWNSIFTAEMPKQYSGGGLTVLIYWMGATATSGNVVWNAYIERDDIGGQDLDSDGFASAQTATTAANGSSGVLSSTSITFTSGAQMDSVVAGEQFRLKIERNAASGSDTMTGDAQVTLVIVRET